MVLAACGDEPDSIESAAGGPQQPGGDLVVLVVSGGQSDFPTLDPTKPGTTNPDYRNAVFGSLFHPGRDGEIEPSLATGYEFSPDNLSVTISLRTGVTFSDGTPFDAEAVVWNFRRALDPATACECRQVFDAVTDVRAEGADKVVMTLSRPFAALIPAFPGTTFNWIASPTAFEQLGEAEFGRYPVGAGPFLVRSNDPSQKIVFERNPGYFEEGLPYLDTLTYQAIGSDQNAVASLQSGAAQVVQAVTTIPLLQQAREQFQLVSLPVTKTWQMQFNTRVPPLDDQVARDALMYATDTVTLNEVLYNDLNQYSQSPTASGGLFFEPEVPGYKTFDLARATELVQQLGGLTVTVSAGEGNINQQNIEALQAMWAKAGIQVSQANFLTLPQIKEQYDTGRWNIHVGRSGAYDPALRLGTDTFFGSEGPNSGVTDPELDRILSDAASSVDLDERGALYREAFQLLSDRSYANFLFEDQRFFLAAQSVVDVDQGTAEIEWQRVSLQQ